MFYAIALSMLGVCIIKPALCGGVIPCEGRCPGDLRCCEQNASTTSIPTNATSGEVKWTTVLDNIVTFSLAFLFLVLVGFLIIYTCVDCVQNWPPVGIRECSEHCGRSRPSEHDSASSVYPPPRYSRCGSFHQPPPPYAEVTAKPDLYPLVITYGEGDSKAGGNYLMVHYFKNYVIQEPGSLSATSTAESLNSSFLCNATNEANSVVPPPYSCASNYDESGGEVCSLSPLTPPPHPRAPTPPPQPLVVTPRARPRTITDNDRPSRRITRYQQNLLHSPQPPERGVFELPRADGSPTTSPLPSTDGGPLEPEFLALQQYFRNAVARRTRSERERLSPPRPVSPTDSVNWPAEERRLKRKLRTRKSSLYMPLTSAQPPPPPAPPRPRAPRAASRSAPATPSDALPTFSRPSRHGSRLSFRNSHLEEESNPLLDEGDTHFDHKF
ncbi:hypothetical protein ACJJTC_008580 [Scirpophaga incertulas]